MRSLIQDVRYAVRQLLKSPGFAITAILSLACGIAATSAVFSVVWGVIMNPYPYANSDRMVHFSFGGTTADGYQPITITASQWQQLRQVPAIEDSALLNYKRFTITGSDLPEDVQGSQMTTNGFNFFGVPPLLGRGLLPSDAADGHDPQPVLVLGYKFWQRRFNGDPAILGKTIQLDHQPYNVVGVAAKRFTWSDADVYLPLKTTAGPDPYEFEARLKPGVSHHVAEQQMQPIIARFLNETPRNFPPKPGPLAVIGLNEQFLKAIGPSLALLFGAVLLLLAIGCGNVSILLLARGVAREHEFAIRAAIGASRGRIIRQLLTEALLLSVTGAALGVLLAYKLLAGIIALLPEYSFPHEAAFAINLPVLSFSVAVALLTGIFFGLWPALRLSRPDVREAMQTGTRKVAGTVSGRALHSALIAGQIALTLLLLSAAGAAVQSFIKLAHAHLGYDPHNTMSIGIPLRDSYATLDARAAYLDLLRSKVAEIPGVNMVAVSHNATPPNNGLNTPMELLGQPSSEDQKIRLNFVSAEYFPLLKNAVIQGRIWTEAENHNANPVAIINETLAHKYFPTGDAIGHSIRMDALKDPPPMVTTHMGADGWLQIIGVTEDKLDDGMRNPVVPEAFVPYTLAMWQFTQLLVRTDGPPMPMIHTIGLQVASVDHDQQIGATVRDLEHWISTQPEYAQGQLISWLFAGFAVLALLLAAVGLYSVVSYTVSQRTNEFGIRMALGAPRSSVLELVARSAVISVGIGVAIGILLTLLLQKGLAHWASATNQTLTPLLFAVAILASVVIIASGIPARRATQVEPMEALRYE